MTYNLHLTFDLYLNIISFSNIDLFRSLIYLIVEGLGLIIKKLTYLIIIMVSRDLDI